MSTPKLSDEALAVLLQEYAFLKDEIKERLQIAFSHVAYAGAIAAFAIPAADKLSDVPERALVLGGVPLTGLPLAVAIIGLLALAGVAWFNMRWVGHCGRYVRLIETRVNAHFGARVLGWEHYARRHSTRRWLWRKGRKARPRQASVPGAG
ncbi:hypothetical protein [Massilia sp. ST3]|uniref:hypothetical protein n=1 Tax=Massilia sp. ST3 TaxID=2824903 RepID=UPI001B8406AD|nr:hypothetical protein [Massilia sp. ST3]MBQ5945900.1 hypothetical protein [Massilia sp. ST3]